MIALIGKMLDNIPVLFKLRLNNYLSVHALIMILEYGSAWPQYVDNSKNFIVVEVEIFILSHRAIMVMIEQAEFHDLITEQITCLSVEKTVLSGSYISCSPNIN